MKAQIPWLRVCLEGAAIVGSILLLFSFAACGTTEPGTEQVQVSGSVTTGGQPVIGPATVTLGVSGRNEVVNTLSATLNGTYAIAGEVASADCSSLFVSIFLTNAFGQTIGFATETLGSCGTQVVDLVLNP